MTISTQRLLIREYEPNDFQSFQSVYSDRDVMKYAFMNAFDTEDSVRSYFHKVLLDRQKGESREAYEFAVIDIETGAYVGSAGFDVHIKNQDGGVAEIGYLLLKAYWGKGFATEIARGLTDACFAALGYHKVCASCNAENGPSERVMQKIGMTREGVFKQKRYKNNQWYDELFYGILKDEWQANIMRQRDGVAYCS